ncbi:hypothetical protein HUO13_01170 [Saccharopolyspora erythraea]|uniref:hypothetical protein n=1 Tax=Saccharopolyspora erythraea TaxID=1836 RepID=UPI001BA9A115|nr:hypothetical protein [Saccharopolyspora erythraea]QUG99593.1 hypothetical protein HUO13_01170 [Saccharopolyspora erythraea]
MFKRTRTKTTADVLIQAPGGSERISAQVRQNGSSGPVVNVHTGKANKVISAHTIQGGVSL